MVSGDEITTNNKNAEKVQSTVAQAVMVFTNEHYQAMIHVVGSTPARTIL